MIPQFISNTDSGDYNDYGDTPSVGFAIKNTTIGPMAIQDTSAGLTNKYWAAYFNTTTKNLTLLDVAQGASTVILNEPDSITHIALAFDQNANDTYAWITGAGELKVRWFDASISGDAVVSLGQAQSVVMTMDTKYYPASSDSDILLFYIRGNAIYYRVQRDKYLIEYATPVTTGANKLLDSGTRKDYRFQVRWT